MYPCTKFRPRDAGSNALFGGYQRKRNISLTKLDSVTESCVNQTRPVKIRKVPQVLPGDQVPGHNENLTAGQFVLYMSEIINNNNKF